MACEINLLLFVCALGPWVMQSVWQRAWVVFCEFTELCGGVCFCKSLHPEVLFPRRLCSVKAREGSDVKFPGKACLLFRSWLDIFSWCPVCSIPPRQYLIIQHDFLESSLIKTHLPFPSQLMNRLLWPKAFAGMLLMCLSGVRPKLWGQ